MSMCTEHLLPGRLVLRYDVCMLGQDVAYYFAPKQDTQITISLCASVAHSDAFDTKLYVVADLLSPRGTRLAPLACNDDFCGYQSQITVGHPCKVTLSCILRL